MGIGNTVDIQVTEWRLIACACVALLGLGGAIYLLATHVDVPAEYWALISVSVLGIAGADIARIVKGNGTNHNNNVK